MWRKLSRLSEPDKVKHFIAGIAIAIVTDIVYWVLMFAFPKLPPIWFVGFLVASIIGALKEIIWDWLLKKGTPEWFDFVTTMFGGIVGGVVSRFIVG